MPFLNRPGLLRVLALATFLLIPAMLAGQDSHAIDYLNFANGALPVRVGGMAEELKVDIDEGLAIIDGDGTGFVVMPKPGAADTEVWFVYRLPAATAFTGFAVPEVRETPSPSKTFFREVEIAGSVEGPEGPLERLAAMALTTHANKGEVTRFPVASAKPVTWVKVTLRGGINVQRDKLAGCGQPAGSPCAFQGDGFFSRHDCATQCLARWSVRCPDGSSLRPAVCSGREGCTPGSCPDGQVCYSFDDPFEKRSYCIPDNVCGEPPSSESRLHWERDSADCAVGDVRQAATSRRRGDGARGVNRECSAAAHDAFGEEGWGRVLAQ